MIGIPNLILKLMDLKLLNRYLIGSKITYCQEDSIKIYVSVKIENISEVDHEGLKRDAEKIAFLHYFINYKNLNIPNKWIIFGESFRYEGYFNDPYDTWWLQYFNYGKYGDLKYLPSELSLIFERKLETDNKKVSKKINPKRLFPMTEGRSNRNFRGYGSGTCIPK